MEERSLDGIPAKEAATAAEEATETAAEEAGNSPEGDDGLLEGLTEEQVAYVDRLKKKATDFDRMVDSRKQRRETARKADPEEGKILSVLHRENERKVLRSVVTEGDPLYIPELVSDENYNQIVGYLPRNVDRSSEKSIHKSLQTAVRLWKEDRGKAGDGEKPKNAAAELSTSRGQGSGKAGEGEKPSSGGRKILKQGSGIDSWYPKK